MSKCGRSICDQITSGCLGECLSDYLPLHTRECDDKISKLEAELEEWKQRYAKSLTDAVVTQEENQKLRDALKFYANESNWLDILDDVPAVFDDRGKIATKALEDN